MPVTIDVTGLPRVTARLHRTGARLLTRVRELMEVTLLEAVSYGRTRYLTGGTTGDRLAVRTGALRSSFQHRLVSQTHEVVGRLGFLRNVPYAPIHEFGGTITPRTSRYLAIPLPAARTAAGVARGGPRSFPNTFVRTGPRGPVIYQRRGAQVVPLFALKRSVTIPARPVLRPTWRRFRPVLLRRLHTELLEE